MAKERFDPVWEAFVAAGKVIVEINCSDPLLIKRLLSNPVVIPGKPKWLHIKAPGHPVQMWLMIDKAWER